MDAITTRDGTAIHDKDWGVGRRSILVGGLTLAAAVAGRRLGAAAARPEITVHKSPT